MLSASRKYELIQGIVDTIVIPPSATEEERIECYSLFIIAHKADYKLTWQDVADLINQICNLNYSESHYRKKYVNPSYEVKEEVTELGETESDVNVLIEQNIRELKKERVKLQDERVQNNAYIRRLAREETIKEIAIETAKLISQQKNLIEFKKYNLNDRFVGTDEAILMLSDWHYGLDFTNYWNSYNTTIAKDRIGQLRDAVLDHCKQHRINKLHVLNLADLIAGRIHLTLRLESRIDVITQIMEVSEMLAELLSDLSMYFQIDYYSCLDNHSRLEPNKSDSLELESLCRVTDWYLKERLKDYPVKILDNIFGEDIITFRCKNYSILGVHGDKDRPTQIIDSISRMTQEHFDLICTAHLHHFSCDEKNNTVVICNGSLMGTDTYAKNLRLSARPSQNLIIVSDKSVCEAIYRILLV